MILALASSFACALLLVPLVRRIALMAGAVAHPREQRWHTRPVPILGGVAVLGACWTAAALRPAIIPILIPGSLMAVVGLADDFCHFRPALKLAGQTVAASVALALVTPARWTGLPEADAALTVLWIVALANAFNLLDNMDGLCAGIAAIAAAGVVCAAAGLPEAYALAAGALLGASAAFLLFNFQPASIFLGDTGSLFLGATVAIVALGSTLSLPRNPLYLAAPLVLAAVPLFDTAFVTLSRWLSRRSASTGGRDHTSHRLVAMGFSDRDAVIVLYALAVGASAAYYGLLRAPNDVGLIVPLLLIALVLVGVHLAGVAVYQGGDFAVLRESAYSTVLVNLTFRRRVFDVLLDMAIISIAYYAAYVLRFPDELSTYLPLFWRSLPIVAVMQLISFAITGMYSAIWRYTGLSDSSRYVKAVGLAILTSVLALVYTDRFEGYSRGVFIIDGMALLMLTVSARLSFRWLDERATRKRGLGRPALLYGAGDGGALIARELWNNPAHDLHPIGFVDDDPSKLNKRVHGVPVLGGIADFRALIAQHRPQVVVITTSKIPPARLQEVQVICFESGTSLLRLTVSLIPLPASRP